MDVDAEAESARLVMRADALRRGFVDDEIARLRRRGDWAVLQRGAYLVGQADLDRRARHLLRVRATLSGLRTSAVVSHSSAAALHGLPLWGLDLARVHVTRRPPARSAEGTRLRSHVARLPDDHVSAVGQCPVTTVARTVVDIARDASFASALAVADAAVRSGSTSRAELRGIVDSATGTRGSRAARRVVEAADGRSESVGESRSRAVMIELGLPRPDLQVEVRNAGGRLIGRCDFGWRAQRLLGEFDGRVKYGRLLAPGQDAGDVVFREKRREDAMRDESWGMVRWVWSELATPLVVGRRIARPLGVSL